MKFLFSVLSIFIFRIISAQVNFSEIPFKDALQQAQSQGKIIFLQFEAANCNQCNDVANKGFDNKEVADKINKTFFCLKINAEHPDRNKISTAYNISADKGFGTLFIDNNGTVVHKFLRTTSFSREYFEQVDIGLMKAGESIKINELEKEYQKGNRSFGFLETLLLKRRSLNLATDSLLNEFVDALPADSLKSIYSLAFIAQMAPLIDSKADKVLRKDPIAFSRAWYTMPLQLGIGINNVIVHKSMSQAIKMKDQNYAARTASFAQGTNTGNYSAGVKAYDLNMLRFYDETGDSSAYFRKSIAYFERYFLTVSPDSIRRIDSLNMQRRITSAKKDTVREGNIVKTVSMVSFAPVAQNFSRELNNGAYEFYKRTNNPYLLSIALGWAEKALQFFKTPEVMDMYAKLLYKQNQQAKAIEVITEAITLQHDRGFSTKEYDILLEKMKSAKSIQN